MNISGHHNSTTAKKSQSGFSILEMIISIVIFLIFTTAIYGLLRIGNIQKSTTNNQTDVIKNLRITLNSIGRDAVNAGLGYSRVGGYIPDNVLKTRINTPSDTNIDQDLLTAIVAGNDVNTNLLLPNPGKTDVISFAFRDFNFNAGKPLELINAQTYGTNGVTISTVAGSAVNAKPFDLYLISDGTRTTVGLVTSVPDTSTVRFEVGDPLGLNLKYDGTVENRSKLVSCASLTQTEIDANVPCMDYTNRVTAKKITWVSYSVNSDGTLVRTFFGNNTGQPAASQIQVQPVAYNVQNFQVRYLLSDGTTMDDPSANATDQDRMNDVVQIQTTITSILSIKENGLNISQPVTLSSTFSTKNLSYDIN